MILTYFFIIILILCTIFYFGAMVVFTVGMNRLPTKKNSILHKISVIVTVKNEEKKLRRCLDGLVVQDYPKDLYEVIIADDQSTDGTAEIIDEFCSQYSNFKSVSIPIDDVSDVIPKKTAMNKALALSSGDIILSTDGDCIVKRQWITSINSAFLENTGMVVGHTEYLEPVNIFAGIDSLDYFSQRALGVGFIGVGSAYTCTASNFAFRREIYEDNKEEFQSLKVLPAEDNYFLYCVHAKSKLKFNAPNASESIVSTEGADSISQFISQRSRWVAYGGNIIMRGVQIFFLPTLLYYVLINILTVWAFFSSTIAWALGGSIAVKAIGDFLFMLRSSSYYNCKKLLWYFLPLAIIHLYFYPIIILKGNLFSFTWKGRTFKGEEEV